MKFFFDNTLAPKLAKGLHEFVSPEHEVVHLKEKLGEDAGDADWMSALAGEEGWIVITADTRAAKNPHLIDAWKQAGHTLFFLKPGWLRIPFLQQAQRFLKCFPAIVERAKQAPQGSSFTVSTNGKVEESDHHRR